MRVPTLLKEEPQGWAVRIKRLSSKFSAQRLLLSLDKKVLIRLVTVGEGVACKEIEAILCMQTVTLRNTVIKSDIEEEKEQNLSLGCLENPTGTSSATTLEFSRPIEICLLQLQEGEIKVF